uniref:Uncharacterized protein n=1 Tax=Coturnix japonica TaxID=93934 RepID=A0A8C2TXT0_COTJA
MTLFPWALAVLSKERLQVPVPFAEVAVYFIQYQDVMLETYQSIGCLSLPVLTAPGNIWVFQISGPQYLNQIPVSPLSRAVGQTSYLARQVRDMGVSGPWLFLSLQVLTS